MSETSSFFGIRCEKHDYTPTTYDSAALSRFDDSVTVLTYRRLLTLKHKDGTSQTYKFPWESDITKVFNQMTIAKATVILFKPNGKYYTEEEWLIPLKAKGRHVIGPYDMAYSPDYRHNWDGPILVVTQEPWGFPHLLNTGVNHA